MVNKDNRKLTKEEQAIKIEFEILKSILGKK